MISLKTISPPNFITSPVIPVAKMTLFNPSKLLPIYSLKNKLTSDASGAPTISLEVPHLILKTKNPKERPPSK
jgi:hypothetical protein